MATDRMTVREFVETTLIDNNTPLLEHLEVFAKGTERVEREIEDEGHRPPKLFKRAEWWRIFDGWLPVFIRWNGRKAVSR